MIVTQVSQTGRYLLYKNIIADTAIQMLIFLMQNAFV